MPHEGLLHRTAHTGLDGGAYAGATLGAVIAMSAFTGPAAIGIFLLGAILGGATGFSGGHAVGYFHNRARRQNIQKCIEQYLEEDFLEVLNDEEIISFAHAVYEKYTDIKDWQNKWFYYIPFHELQSPGSAQLQQVFNPQNNTVSAAIIREKILGYCRSCRIQNYHKRDMYKSILMLANEQIIADVATNIYKLTVEELRNFVQVVIAAYDRLYAEAVRFSFYPPDFHFPQQSKSSRDLLAELRSSPPVESNKTRHYIYTYLCYQQTAHEELYNAGKRLHIVLLDTLMKYLLEHKEVELRELVCEPDKVFPPATHHHGVLASLSHAMHDGHIIFSILRGHPPAPHQAPTH